MSGCDDGCCGCISYRTRMILKYGGICFGGLVVVVLFALLLLAYAFIIPMTITVEDALLTRFTLLTSPKAALAYNLSLTLSVRNPNLAINITNTEPFEAAYKFYGQQFDRVQVADKGDYHPAGKTIAYHLARAVASEIDYVALGLAGVAKYKEESKTGLFEVEVALTRKVRYTARYTECKIEATCPLKLRLVEAGRTNTFIFEKVKCKLAQAEKNC